MGIALGIIIFFIGCLVSSVEEAEASARRREERRHRELMKLLSEPPKQTEGASPARKRVVRRRIAQDKDGNVLAEEITEEAE